MRQRRRVLVYCIVIAHLIHFKGRGNWVLATPLIAGIVLFMFCDIAEIDTGYVRPACLLISAVILWFADKGHHLILYGKSPNKGKNSMLWVDMKYWAIIMAVLAFVDLALVKR